jgi:RsiW-degrading membrane proteinase PrsW (M82 family)
MSAQLQLAMFGALPALVAMMVFDRLDAKRPEPRSTLRAVALAGALSVIPVIALGTLLKWIGPAAQGDGAPASMLGALYAAFVVAALPEEAAKMASVLLFAWRKPEFDERMDGIVYGARAGLGFALVENVAYLLLLPSSFGEYVAVFLGRAVLSVPGHAMWGAIMGYFAAVRRFDGRGPGLLGGYLLAVLLHGIYDAWLFGLPIAVAQGASWLALGIAGIPVVAYSVPVAVILCGGIALRRFMRSAIAADDLDEARRQAGWIPQTTWPNAADGWPQPAWPAARPPTQPP